MCANTGGISLISELLTDVHTNECTVLGSSEQHLTCFTQEDMKGIPMGNSLIHTYSISTDAKTLLLHMRLLKYFLFLSFLSCPFSFLYSLHFGDTKNKGKDQCAQVIYQTYSSERSSLCSFTNEISVTYQSAQDMYEN